MITVDRIRNLRNWEMFLYRLAGGGFRHEFVSRDVPRLKIIKERPAGKMEQLTRYLVDGKPVPSIKAACEVPNQETVV